MLPIVLFLLVGCSGEGGTPGNTVIAIGMEKPVTVVAGQELQIPVTVTQNGQPIQNPQLTWQVVGDIGTISSTGLFKAVETGVTTAAPKTGKIQVSGYGKTTDTEVTVIVGPLTRILIISPTGVDLSQLPLNATVNFTAVGEDEYGNRGAASRIAVTPTWSVVGDIGTINAQGQFHATKVGSGKVVAQVNALSAEVAITVVTDPDGSFRIVGPAGFDPNNVLLGQVVPFHVEEITSVGSAGRALGTPTWAVQGGIGTITQQGVFTATAIGNGQVTATIGDQTAELALHVTRVIPEGTIVFVYREDGYNNLATISAGSLTPQALTSGTNNFTQPQWSPDGSSILFMSQNHPTLHGICEMSATGTGAHLIYNSRGQDPCWSPDAGEIAFSNGQVAVGEIDLITAGGRFLSKLAVGAVGNPRYPVWSPDGTQIAFSVGSGLSNGIFIIDSRAENPPQQIFSGVATQIRWPAGRPQVIVATDNHRIFAVPISGGAPEVLVDEEDPITGGFALAPDLSAVVYGVSVDGTIQLRMKILASGVTTQLTTSDEISSLEPDWKE